MFRNLRHQWYLAGISAVLRQQFGYSIDFAHQCTKDLMGSDVLDHWVNHRVPHEVAAKDVRQYAGSAMAMRIMHNGNSLPSTYSPTRGRDE